MINATPQEWYAYRHGIERVPVARLIARDRNCWGGTAKWLGPQLSADVCMELILSLSECSDIGGYFGYAYGGDRNCACYDPTRDCSHPNAVQYMPNIGVYLIELPEIVLPTKLVTIGATEGFNETSQQELVVSIARSAVISLERIVVINVTDKVPGTHGGVVVELLILSNNNSKWEHELTSAQVLEHIQQKLQETRAPTRSPTQSPTQIPSPSPTTPAPTEPPTTEPDPLLTDPPLEEVVTTSPTHAPTPTPSISPTPNPSTATPTTDSPTDIHHWIIDFGVANATIPTPAPTTTRAPTFEIGELMDSAVAVLQLNFSHTDISEIDTSELQSALAVAAQVSVERLHLSVFDENENVLRMLVLSPTSTKWTDEASAAVALARMAANYSAYSAVGIQSLRVPPTAAPTLPINVNPSGWHRCGLNGMVNISTMIVGPHNDTSVVDSYVATRDSGEYSNGLPSWWGLRHSIVAYMCGGDLIGKWMFTQGDQYLSHRRTCTGFLYRLPSGQWKVYNHTRWVDAEPLITCNQNYNSTYGPCRGTGAQLLRSNSSVVISDGPFIAPEHTARLGRCTWVFHSTMQISVQFTELDMEKGYDFVKVYEGASSDGLLLRSFTGSDVNAENAPVVTSSQGAGITVVLSTDVMTTGSGFVATVFTLPNRSTVTSGSDSMDSDNDTETLQTSAALNETAMRLKFDEPKSMPSSDEAPIASEHARSLLSNEEFFDDTELDRQMEELEKASADLDAEMEHRFV